MTLYCKVGDVPTVFYSFANQPEQTVTFHLAPINVEVTDSADANGTGGSEQEIIEPCPTDGKICTVVYTLILRLGDSYEYEPGQYHEFYPGGYIFKETYLSFMYEGDDSWEFNYYDFAFLWRIEATCFYRYADSVVRPGSPDYYEDLINDGNGIKVGDWAISDSCFPKGGRPETCYKPGQEPPPKPPDPKDKSVIKVSYNNKEIWRAEGNSPCNYNVTCKNDCPPGYLKLKADNPKGFCCIPCKDVQFEVSQIKALLRQRNG